MLRTSQRAHLIANSKALLSILRAFGAVRFMSFQPQPARALLKSGKFGFREAITAARWMFHAGVIAQTNCDRKAGAAKA